MLNYNDLLANPVRDLAPSSIRRFFTIAAENPNVISLSVGEPDQKTPLAAREAAERLLAEGDTKYTSNAGMIELRQEISRYLDDRFDLRYDPEDEIVLTVGGSEAIDIALRSVLNPGDEVIVSEPCFVCYAPLAEICRAKVVHLPVKAENGFALTPEELRGALTDKTKLLILPYPSNPTGAIMTREQLEAIAEVLRGTNVLVLSDEIYAELTYNGLRHVSIASLPGMRERTIVINGFSKMFAMTGWRLGYVAGPAALVGEMFKIHQYGIMSAPTMAQVAALVALRECREDIERMHETYDARRKMLVARLNEIGLETTEPLGAFYCFPSIRSTGMTSEEFCYGLLEEQEVAIIPGTAFGTCGEGFARISYSYSMEHLTIALERIERFMRDHRG